MSNLRKVFALKQVEIPWSELKKGELFRLSSNPGDFYGNDKQWNIAKDDSTPQCVEADLVHVKLEVDIFRYPNVIPATTKRFSVASTLEDVKEGEHFIPIHEADRILGPQLDPAETMEILKRFIKSEELANGMKPTVEVDWGTFSDYTPNFCTCRCGAYFRSHSKFVARDEFTGVVTKEPCPGCGKDNDCCSVRSGPETMEV